MTAKSCWAWLWMTSSLSSALACVLQPSRDAGCVFDQVVPVLIVPAVIKSFGHLKLLLLLILFLLCVHDMYLWSQFSPFTFMWTLGTKMRSSSLCSMYLYLAEPSCQSH